MTFSNVPKISEIKSPKLYNNNLPSGTMKVFTTTGVFLNFKLD